MMGFYRPLHQCMLPFSEHELCNSRKPSSKFSLATSSYGFFLDPTWCFSQPLILLSPALLLLPSFLCSYWFSLSPNTENGHPATASHIVPFWLVSCQVFYSWLALFAAPLLLTSYLAYSLTLNMEAIHSTKTSLDLYLTTWCYRTRRLYSSRLICAQYIRNDTHLQQLNIT
jgi:hypothetical protein